MLFQWTSVIETPVLYKFVLTYCEIMLCRIGLIFSHFSSVGEVIYLLSTVGIVVCIEENKPYEAILIILYSSSHNIHPYLNMFCNLHLLIS